MQKVGNGRWAIEEMENPGSPWPFLKPPPRHGCQAPGLPLDRVWGSVWRRAMPHFVFRFALLAGALSTALATEPNPAATRTTSEYVPDVAALATPSSSE